MRTKQILIVLFIFIVAATGTAHAAGITVDSTADNLTAGDGNCTLREAIMNANSDSDTTSGDCTAGSGADTITVPAGTYTLSIAGSGEDLNATGDLDVTGDLTINGAGARSTIVDANGIDRVFDVFNVTASLNDLTIQNGDAPASDGGGVLNRGALTINRSTITGNTATNATGGGGIANAGTVTINDSLVHNNTATGGGFDSGGGLFNTFGGTANVNNSTFSGNTADFFGGGVFQEGTAVTIRNSTFSGNTGSLSGGGISNDSAVDMQNSIVTNSTGGDCDGSGTYNGSNNLIDDNASGPCSGISSAAVTNFATTLADNGGPTDTHALQSGSNAIDAGTGSCPDHTGSALTTDQRGVSRPQGSTCDIGAVERVSAVTPGANGGDGPGGVGTTDGSSTLEMWLRGDRGVFSDAACSTTASGGGNAGCWHDQSGNDYHPTQATGGNQPVYQTGLINGQPALRFDGSDDYLQKAWESDLNPATFSVYGLWQTTGGAGTNRSPLTSRNTSPARGWNFYADLEDSWEFWTGTGSDWSTLGTTVATLDQWVLLNGTYDGTIQAIYADGALDQSLTRSYAQNTSAPLHVGAGYGGGSTSYYFLGDIAEVTVYSEAHNDVERTLIENYLSAKYDTTISNDHYDGDTAGNGDFDLDVAGIGQTGGNQHTQAHGAGMIVVDDGFLQDNGDWLLFGHNIAANSNSASDLPTSGDWSSAPDPRRWARHWYIDVTDANSNGSTVDIIFDFGEAGMDGDAAKLPSTPASNYRLLKRSGTTGAFSDITGASGATVVIVDDQVQFLGVDVAQLGSNFTLGTLDYGNSPTAVRLRDASVQSRGAGTTAGLLTISLVTLAAGLLVVRRRR